MNIVNQGDADNIYSVKVFPIDLRRTVGTKEDPKGREFYEFISRIFTDDQETAIMDIIPYSTIAVGVQHLHDKQYLNNQILPGLPNPRNAHKVIIIIDMLTLNRMNSYFAKGIAFGTYLELICDYLKEFEVHTVIFLVPTLLAKVNPRMEHAVSSATSHNIIVIDSEGNVDGNPSLIRRFDKEAYQQASRELSSPYRTISRKLIRRIGNFHFEKADGANASTHIYYDCSYCHEEISDLIAERIHNCISEIDLVIWHSQDNLWMSAIMPLVRKKLQRFKDLCFVAREEDPGATIICKQIRDFFAEKGEQPRGAIVITPVVDTGATVTYYDRFLKREFTLITRRYFLSVLSSDGMREHGGSRSLSYEGIAIEADYLVRVRERNIGEWKRWYTRLKFPAPQSSLWHMEDSGKLSSFAWWFMAKEVELKKEDRPPNHRDGYGYLPNIKELVALNGPWLALKFHNNMANPNYKSASNIIICPKDEGVEALTDNLNEMLSYDVVPIPRGVIAKFVKMSGEAAARAIIHKDHHDEDWYRTLEKWRKNFFDSQVGESHPIIVDKFIVTGATIEGIKTILTVMELPVVAALTVVDFCPRAKRSIKVISLYDIDYTA